MHILFTSPWYHTNQHFSSKALLDAGHDVSFLVLRRGSKEEFDLLRPTVHLVVGKSPGMEYEYIEEGVPPLFRFWRQMRDLNPDIVVVREHGHAYALLAAVVARLIGSDVILYKLTPVHRQMRWWHRTRGAFAAWILRAKWMSPVLGSPDRYPPAFGALRYVPFAMEPLTKPSQRQWFRDGAINCICIGAFRPRKNHRLFLQAVARLSETYPIRATIIGDCVTKEHGRELAELKVCRESLGLTDQVRFRTNLPFSDVQQEYATHDLFVLPARDEPAGISLLEAMAHSLPVVCSDSCGLKACVRVGGNGYVFETDNVDDLEVCMENIMSDRDRLVRMGTASYETVVSEHAPDRYLKKLLDLTGRKG